MKKLEGLGLGMAEVFLVVLGAANVGGGLVETTLRELVSSGAELLMLRGVKVGRKPPETVLESEM